MILTTNKISNESPKYNKHIISFSVSTKLKDFSTIAITTNLFVMTGRHFHDDVDLKSVMYFLHIAGKYSNLALMKNEEVRSCFEDTSF